MSAQPADGPLSETAPDDQPARSPREEAQPADDAVVEVAPGILRIQLPVEMPGLGHVNCYVLEDGDGFTVVDPGLPGPDSHQVLVERMKDAGGSVSDIHTVVVTHSHIDHFGGAGRLKVEHDAQVVAFRNFRTFVDITPADFEPDFSPEAITDGPSLPSFADLLMGDHDLDLLQESIPSRRSPWGTSERPPIKGFIERMRQWDDASRNGMLSPQPTRRVDDAEVITLGRREWVALHTPGHTNDHLCLYDPASGTLLSGDHVLPTITPHISGYSPDQDPLRLFFDALAKVGAIEGVKLALPAHGQPFTDVVGRVEAIRRHHQQRLEALTDIAEQEGEATVTAYSHQLFRPTAWGEMASSETYAHLEHLRIMGVASSAPGADGEIRFRIDTDAARAALATA